MAEVGGGDSLNVRFWPIVASHQVSTKLSGNDPKRTLPSYDHSQVPTLRDLRIDSRSRRGRVKSDVLQSIELTGVNIVWGKTDDLPSTCSGTFGAYW